MEQRIEVVNSHNKKLVGKLFHDSDTLVIICHGYESNKDFITLKRIASFLQVKHFSTLRFDFSGSGESEGSKEISLKRQVSDLEKIIEYSSQYKQIILVGLSLGALPVSIASQNKKVYGIVTINGFFDGNIKHKPFRRVYFGLKLSRWFIPRIYDEFKFFRNMMRPEQMKKPMLLITTPNDEVLDYKQSEDWYNKLSSPKKLVEVHLTDHGLSQEEDARIVVDTIINWLKELH